MRDERLTCCMVLGFLASFTASFCAVVYGMDLWMAVLAIFGGGPVAGSILASRGAPERT